MRPSDNSIYYRCRHIIEGYLRRILRSSELRIAYRELRMVAKLEPAMQALSDEALQAKTDEFRRRLAAGETLSSLRVEAYAVVREAAVRILHKRPFDVQVLAGIVLDLGVVAEMKTGEGKTITSLFPVYLNALTGQSVVVSTVNEYLAQRDSEEMGAVFNWLSLSVGVNLAHMQPDAKRAAYACDITYSTHSELGFDYLRDNMVTRIEDKVQRGLHFAIIDEADSILIDEAKTPLIISGGESHSADLYTSADNFVRQLRYGDYEIDEESRTVRLTERGIDLANQFFSLRNLYEIANSELIHRIQNAMRAHLILKRDIEYIVSEQMIKLVDGFTGRIMEGRAFSEGLQQALQAKEHVEIEPETRVLATTTYQNFFRLYHKLAGMTGTAKTEEQEFIDIYNMRVVCIPTNLPTIRDDQRDVIYASLDAKYQAIVEHTRELWQQGQPVLIGTGQVETSEVLHRLLLQADVPHKVLNAKQNSQEAEIIAKAGQVGAVTIATNMAGRGTDIKPSPEALRLGGLYIIGTERAEARRIDNQLRGRAGRQGDVGVSRFYLSLEDTLIIRFATHERLRSLFSSHGTAPIHDRILANTFIRAQKKIEGFNYDQRKSVLNYDDVIRQQRDLIYEQRDLILRSATLAPIIYRMIYNYVQYIITVELRLTQGGQYNEEPIIQHFNSGILANYQFRFDAAWFESVSNDELLQAITDKLYECFQTSRSSESDTYGESYVLESERRLILNVLDKGWQRHIMNMDRLRQAAHVFQYAQKNPFQVYTEEGGRLFLRLIDNVARETVEQLFATTNEGIHARQEQFHTILLGEHELQIGSWGSLIFDEGLNSDQRLQIFSWLQENSHYIQTQDWDTLSQVLNERFWAIRSSRPTDPISATEPS